MQRRRKQLLDELKETRGYWKLYEEALDRNVCRTRFGRGYGPVIKQDYKINKYTIYKCGRGSHNTTWGPRVGYPCCIGTSLGFAQQNDGRCVHDDQYGLLGLTGISWIL